MAIVLPVSYKGFPMALEFREKVNGKHPLPEVFKGKKFRSYVDMSNFADEHHLPEGEYFIRTTGTSFMGLRELKRTKTRFWVEGRGNV